MDLRTSAAAETRRSPAWLFNAVCEVQRDADDWLGDYSEFRPHESLDNMPPVIFKARVFNEEVFTPGLSP